MSEKALDLNTAARLEVRRIGHEQQPVVIFDGALTNPEVLVEAARVAAFARPTQTRYPGLNAPLPAAYLTTLVPALRKLMAKVFEVPENLRLTQFGFFALATLAPDELEPIQKIPHQDTPEHQRLASVHYLSEPSQGIGKAGTGFFRHRATGYEAVTPEQRAHYVATVAAELETGGARLTRHVSEDTPCFELIDWVPAAFNRLVLYRSNVLHSALIDGVALSDDTATGRLTANLFMLPVQKLF
ncbi:DUF6445 family protein [Asticcacaulis sp. AC402]|uniref:DUF6445 family protein n=1 Tax=Asticcacaulis sp. AC402 TaxID=1282361 RepID=UPI0003C3D7CB|nr:DUF6445 family protein [Asticcacaulis sp. AC402]ESQ75914.1 hypothetical protein ABAC402_08090 [Asticcacaulis sp. AC402]